jgi:hypothetical protein
MKVFVSSTYIDLKEHRQAVDEIVNRLSLQFRGMEYFGSRPFEPEKVCFDEIAQCQIFIGIYAHRYGYIPQGNELSITEQEFDFARRKGLDCYCYIIEPTQPWPPPYIEHDASQKLHMFLDKVSSLVRSTFTSPDNLAKQVAADLQLAFGRTISHVDGDQLRNSLQTFCKQEITTTIGPKYVKELYVGRKLNASIKKEIKRVHNISKVIKSIKVGAEEAYGLLININLKKLVKNERKPIYRAKRSLRNGLKGLGFFDNLRFPQSELCYPSNELNTCLSQIKDAVVDGQRSIPRRLFGNSENIAQWDTVYYRIIGDINNLERSLRPISIIVDRAGGGKTNLLCHLAEDIGETHHCFFVSAKSIPYPSEEAIIKYLSSVYPISNDPIETSLSMAVQHGMPVIIIVDGINENFDPIQFNVAFKALVRRYYGKPVLYIVSCRDIYWNYFEDSWWQSHCSLISRDELYEFTASEFRKALPLYLRAYDIEASPVGDARDQLHHPLLLRFYCEAFKGLPGKPAKIGQVEDIRLLELFDAYCDRKFQQIKERLGLISADEVFDYLQVIARLMLTEHIRLLPVRRVAYHIQNEFNEKTIRSIDSRYVQILDEDILLEQRPSGQQMDIMVSFVYDEFMEYVIAKAIWSEMCQRVDNPNFEEVKDVVSTLLKQEEKFISVLGIAVYLGELLATKSQKDALHYVGWLVSKGKETLACRLIVRWPIRNLENSVFEQLIEIHSRGKMEKIKLEAWRAMGKLCLHHWDIFFDYVKHMSLTGYFRPTTVFSLLGKVDGGPESVTRLETIRWIVKAMTERVHILFFVGSRDYRTGISSIKRIISSTKTTWSKEQFKQAESLLRGALSLRGATK